MRSSFFEFNVAQTGLFTARNAITVASHNIANRNTDGYSRQVSLQRADTPLSLGMGKGMIGTGSIAYGVAQIRSSYLDQRYWATNSTLGEFSSKRIQNQLLEAIFAESADTGFNVATDKFFNTLQTLTESAGDYSYRTAATQSALTMTQYFNDTAASLQKQQRDINNEVKLVVTQINTIGRQIQNLNKQIYTSELDGSNANDLRDQRALLIDELSKYANVEVKEVNLSNDQQPNNKQYFVSINGYDFVSHFDMNELEVRERTLKNNPEDVDGLFDVYWKNSGVKLNSTTGMSTLTGELKGLLDIRDGNNLNTMSGKIDSVTSDVPAIGMKTVVLSGVTRNDMAEKGNIVINGKTYAYNDFTYDEATDTVTITIPPTSGQMLVGNTVVNYSNLVLDTNGNITSFDAAPPLTSKQLGQTIRIGEMIITGSKASGAGSSVTVSGNTLGTDLGTAVAGDNVTIGTKVNAKGIPYYMSKLNTYVRTLARAFNEGQNINGDPITGVGDPITGGGHNSAINDKGGTGYNFFSYYTDKSADLIFDGKGTIDYTKITAGNFTVASELIEDPRLLAAAYSDQPDESDNNWVLAMLSIKHNDEVFATGELGNFLQSIQGELAVESSQSILFEKNYVSVLSTVDNQRLSISGVDENEEMANVIRFQQAFNAAAKLINVIDGIYDTLINKLGLM